MRVNHEVNFFPKVLDKVREKVVVCKNLRF